MGEIGSGKSVARIDGETLVQPVLLHLLVQRLAGDPELLIDGPQGTAVSRDRIGDQLFFISRDLVGKPSIGAFERRRTVEPGFKPEHQTVGCIAQFTHIAGQSRSAISERISGSTSMSSRP